VAYRVWGNSDSVRGRVRGSASGIADQSDLDQAKVDEALASLAGKGVVAERASREGPRWFLTTEGRVALPKMTAGPSR
jgi:DNA-binding MarR family transcriptional regulator